MTGRIVARYDYLNSKGSPQIRKIRREPKTFMIRSWDSEAEMWLSGLRDNRFAFWTRALYKLPELVAALRVDVPVYWCEGEKDAETLLALGLTATTTPNPSELWDDQCRWFVKFRSQSEVMVMLTTTSTAAGGAGSGTPVCCGWGWTPAASTSSRRRTASRT